MTDLPPELEGFASLLEAQPQPVREVFQYCLCLMMVEAGKMRLVDTVPGEASPISVFESAAGESFSVARPPMSQEEEAEVKAMLREILKDEGML
ncbi:MAG TPA: hypothetical protein VFI27_02345 [candidate division Zixibacteria bacterium]|nr:hypothetical protein [candidate division Zixibacteria bacterium]